MFQLKRELRSYYKRVSGSVSFSLLFSFTCGDVEIDKRQLLFTVSISSFVCVIPGMYKYVALARTGRDSHFERGDINGPRWVCGEQKG